MSLPNSSPVAGADVEAAPIRANLVNLDTRLASMETQIADLAVSMDTYANGIFIGGLSVSAVGKVLMYTPGGLVCGHTYYFKSTLMVDFTGYASGTYYIEVNSAGDVGIFLSLDSNRTNLNTVVFNGVSFDSILETNRTYLYGDDQFVALLGRSGGQIIRGGIAANESLVLEPTAHATKGCIVIGTGIAGIDYALKFDGETNDGVLTWMEDEDCFKFSDDILMDTTEQHYFRDTALYISSKDDGHLDIDADISVDLNSPLLDFSTNKAQFRDSAIFINSIDDGHLDLTADVSIDVNGVLFAIDKIAFTQTDGNEYIDSLADGYLDYSVTTAHRFKMSTADTDVRLEFIGTTNSGLVEWMEDEDYLRFSDGLLMNSTEEIFFRDSAINIASEDDGHLDIAADISIDINAPIIYTKDVQPDTDNSYYLGKNSITTPLAYKGLILKDESDGFYYRITTVNGIVTATKIV